MALRVLARSAVWPTTSGGHYANETAATMEQYGAFTPDTADPLIAPVSITFTVPNVAQPKVLVMFSCDMFTNTAGTEHGYIGLHDGTAIIAGSRKRMSSGGPNNKRRVVYSHILDDLTPEESVTLTLMWEGGGADDVRANQSDTGLTRNLFEAFDVSAVGSAPIERLVRSVRAGVLV